MAEWQTRIKLEDGVKPEAYQLMMETVWRVSKVSRVPKNASWQCFKRGKHYFFNASWERGKEKWL